VFALRLRWSGKRLAIRVLSVVDTYRRECLALDALIPAFRVRASRVFWTASPRSEGCPSAFGATTPGTHQPSFSRVACGTPCDSGTHSARLSDAERPCGKLPRQVARRVPERELVRKLIRVPQTNSSLGKEYNESPPHCSLGYRTPSEFAELAENTGPGDNTLLRRGKWPQRRPLAPHHHPRSQIRMELLTRVFV